MTSTHSRYILWRVAAIWMFGIFSLPFAARHALAATSLWDNVNGGFFSEPLNWFGGVPGPNDFARFETTDSNFFQREYIVDFTTDITNRGLTVEDDSVKFNLKGHTYKTGAATIGTVPNRSGKVIVTNGTLEISSRLVIAGVGSGILTIGGAGRVSGFPDVFVGGGGDGTLEINSGGVMEAATVTVGSFGRPGHLTVAGSASSLRTSTIDMLSTGSEGTLRIEDGGAVEVFGALLFNRDDAIHLERGELFVSLLPILDQRSFSWTSGTLAFGNCQDNLTIPSGGVLAVGKSRDIFFTSRMSGNLTLLPGATTTVSINQRLDGRASQIHVDGHVALDGGKLQLSVDGSLPSPEAQFEIITSGLGITGSFANVANGQRLLTSDGLGSFVVNYGPGNPHPNHVVLSAFVPGGLLPGDYNHNGSLDAGDLDLQAVKINGPFDGAFDLNQDNGVNFDDRKSWVNSLKKTYFGDADLNGEFNSSDLITMFAAGKYETGSNATWAEGDFDGDLKVGSGDLVQAFADGGYEQGPRAALHAVPEPSSFVMLIMGLMVPNAMRQMFLRKIADSRWAIPATA